MTKDYDRIHDREDNRHLDRKYGADDPAQSPDDVRDERMEDVAEFQRKCRAAADEADKQAQLWRFIESGDLGALTKVLPK